MKMKIAVTGYRGKLGRRLAALGAFPMYCDITNETQVKSELKEIRPDVVVHAAAVSSVSLCQKNYVNAVQVNCWGTSNLAQLADEFGARVLLLSSEQVFDGKWWGRYKEDSKPNPINNYGITKLAAEGIVSLYDGKILRLSRGISSDDGDMLPLMKLDEISIPSFFYRNYQHLDCLAAQIWHCANDYENIPEILHIGGEDYLSYYDLVKKIAAKINYNGKIIKRRKDFTHLTPRPHKCGFNLSAAKKLGVPMYSVDYSIERLLSE